MWVRSGVAATFSFYPTKNLFGLGDGGLVALARRRDRRPRPRSCASTARATRSASRRSATTRASTSSRPPRCVSSSVTSTAGTTSGARPPRATPSSASASSCELPEDDPGHVYHVYVVRTPERDRIAAALRDAGHRLRDLLHDAAAPPAGLRLARRRPRACPRPSAPRARRSPSRSGRGSRRRSRSRSWPRSAPRSAWGQTREARSAAIASSTGRRDAGLLTLAWYLAFQLRFDFEIPARYDDSSGTTSSIVVGHQARRLRPLRPLQPLVALRLHPGHVAGDRARRHRRLGRRLRRHLPRRPGRELRLPRSDHRHRLDVLARARRRARASWRAR